MAGGDAPHQRQPSNLTDGPLTACPCPSNPPIAADHRPLEVRAKIRLSSRIRVRRDRRRLWRPAASNGWPSRPVAEQPAASPAGRGASAGNRGVLRHRRGRHRSPLTVTATVRAQTARNESTAGEKRGAHHTTRTGLSHAKVEAQRPPSSAIRDHARSNGASTPNESFASVAAQHPNDQPWSRGTECRSSCGDRHDLSGASWRLRSW